MSKAHYREATVRDAFELAKNLRPEDKQELEGMGHNTLSLPFLVMLSSPAIALFDDNGDLAGIGGITPDPSKEGVGVVWLLCTPVVTRQPHTLVKGLKKWLAGVTGYKLLWNLVDARNTYHHKLLKLLGFKAIRTVNTAPFFLPYYEIVKVCASPS